MNTTRVLYFCKKHGPIRVERLLGVIFVYRLFGVLVKVFDPRVKCGAASTILYGGRGDPSFVGSSVVEMASR
jgi:hypothetical protein